MSELIKRTYKPVSLLLTSITFFMLASCGGGTTEDGTTLIITSPPAATLYRGEQIYVRVDIEGLPSDDAITGYTIDICDGDPAVAGTNCGLGEVGTKINIDTLGCGSDMGTAWCENWLITPAADAKPKTYFMTIDAVGAATAISSHMFVINVLLPEREKRVHLRYSSQLDANEIYYWAYDRVNDVETKYELHPNLTDYRAPIPDGSGGFTSPEYDASLAPIVTQFLDADGVPDSQICCRFEFNQEEVGGFLGDPPRYEYQYSRDFAVGINRLGPEYTLIRETMFVFDYFSTPSSRFEQIYRGPDTELHVFLPGWQPWVRPDGLYIPDEADYTRPLSEMIAEGYSVYDGAEYDNVSGSLSVGGNISDLVGTVILQNETKEPRWDDFLPISTNGPFKFHELLATGDAYNISVYEQPKGQTCSVSNGSGTIASENVSNALVNCEDAPIEDPDCVNVSGVWKFNFTNIDSSCGPEGDWDSTVNIEQTACYLHTTGMKGTSHIVPGNVDGDTITIGPEGFPDSGGTTTSTFILKLISPTRMNGNEQWTWQAPGFDSCINGTGNITAIKQ